MATSNILMEGELGGGDDLVEAAGGTTLTSSLLRLNDLSNGAVDETTALVDLESFATGSWEQAFSAGTTLTFEGERSDDHRKQGPRTLAVEATTTLGDLMDFMVNAFGINTDAPTPAGATAAGAVVTDMGGGAYTFDITGNVGAENSLWIGTGGLQSSWGAMTGPLSFGRTAEAVGSGLYTNFQVYDSLGNARMVDLTFVFESDDNAGRTWRWFANSPEDSDVSTVLGSGTVSFNTNGDYLSATGSTFRLDLDDSGTTTPLEITMDLSRVLGVFVTGDDMEVTLADQDGEKAGDLLDFSISADGTILGAFSNDSTRVLGQLALATFSNYAGLVDAGQNLFKEGPNSGMAIIGKPLSNGAGKVWGGAIETSNVDISREFIEMIIASTGFSASSRVVTTANQLLTELLQTVR
jgi:flagellar hook protein FlgE